MIRPAALPIDDRYGEHGPAERGWMDDTRLFQEMVYVALAAHGFRQFAEMRKVWTGWRYPAVRHHYREQVFPKMKVCWKALPCFSFA